MAAAKVSAATLAHVALTAALIGCGGGDSTPPSMSVYRYMGSVQCSGDGISLATMQEQLLEGGVTVLASACGADGKAHVAMCGAPDGAIGIFDIPAGQTARALSLSFARPSELPAATRVPCR